MKKCSACAKDLPDTAMHCVFCGAKQAPVVPANPQAKTVMGYSAAELLKQAGIGPGGVPAGGQAQPPQGFAPPQAAPYQPPQPAPAPFQPPAPAPYQPPQPAPFQPPQPQAAPYQPPAPAPYQPPQPAPAPFQPPQPAPFQPQGGGFPPPAQGGQFGGSASTAATMFMQPSPVIPQTQPQQPAPFQPPQPAPFQPPAPAPFQPPQPAPFQPPQAQPYPQPAPFQPPQPMGGYSPPMQQPGQPPYLASQTASRADKPIDPFKDVMRTVLLLFGGLLIAAFVVPIKLSPDLAFMWDMLGAPGLAKLVPLLIAAVGVLSVVVAVTPMATVGRGGIAALLGLVPIGLFLTLVGSFEWHMFAGTVGGVVLIAGLLMRNEYTRDPLPKLFITVGAAAIVVTHLVPFTIVDEITAALDAPGLTRLVAMLGLGPTVIAVLALGLAWLPGPGSAGAKPLAWTFLMWPAIIQGTLLLVALDEAIDLIKASPNLALMTWTWASPTITGGGDGFGGQPGVAFVALAGFGLAVLFGKQLEMKR